VILSKGRTPESEMALQDLCEAYYDPVYHFIRERRPHGDEARDLTQEFFARVLDRSGFQGADPTRGRFRSFLLGAVKHFLSAHRAHAERKKRGGGIEHQSLDAPSFSQDPNATAANLQVADPNALSPDQAFDQLWANTVLERALDRLEKDCQRDGKGQQFEVLQPWLAGGADRPQAEAAYRLGLSESATRVAIHRLRQKFRGAVRSELAHTLGPGISVKEELGHLFAALTPDRQGH
jgi:RNA polymerase sigma-70 factor (ECF subfamily)